MPDSKIYPNFDIEYWSRALYRGANHRSAFFSHLKRGLRRILAPCEKICIQASFFAARWGKGWPLETLREFVCRSYKSHCHLRQLQLTNTQMSANFKHDFLMEMSWSEAPPISAIIFLAPPGASITVQNEKASALENYGKGNTS